MNGQAKSGDSLPNLGEMDSHCGGCQKVIDQESGGVVVAFGWVLRLGSKEGADDQIEPMACGVLSMCQMQGQGLGGYKLAIAVGWKSSVRQLLVSGV